MSKKIENSDLIDLLHNVPKEKPVSKKTKASKTAQTTERPSEDFQPVQKTSFELKRDTHEVLKEIARRNGLSLRQLISAVLLSFIEKYVKEHGPVTPRESKISLDKLI